MWFADIGPVQIEIMHHPGALSVIDGVDDLIGTSDIALAQLIG